MKGADKLVCAGGRDRQLGTRILAELNAGGIRSSMAKRGYAGVHPDNICNRGKRKKGVQLEISRGLRDCPQDIVLLSDLVSRVLKADVECLLRKNKEKMLNKRG